MITFKFPELPPSVNSLYFSKGGRRILSSAGRAYKSRFISSRGGADPIEFMNFSPDPFQPYELTLWFYLSYERLYNISYGENKRTKSPFSDLDVSNLIKLAEDAIAELVGLRDRNNFTVCSHKREAHDGHEQVIAVLKQLNLEADPYEHRREIGKAHRE